MRFIIEVPENHVQLYEVEAQSFKEAQAKAKVLASAPDAGKP
jgi:hypothetical protein